MICFNLGMKINNNRIEIGQTPTQKLKQKNHSNDKPAYNNDGLDNIAAYNKAAINFCGYHGDQQPAKKLFWILTGRNNICKDDETEKIGRAHV